MQTRVENKYMDLKIEQTSNIMKSIITLCRALFAVALLLVLPQQMLAAHQPEYSTAGFSSCQIPAVRPSI